MKQTRVLRAAERKVQRMDWGTLTWFASRELGNSGAMTLGQCVIKPGRANPRHRHPNCEEILTVAHGRIVHAIEDGREIEMNEGDTITIPVGLAHNARNVGDSDAVLFIAFTSADRQTKGE